uniref:Uncharacterized protein n=1 Tax=Amphimedon queenslandica TaxID=400682 RepID=A0A1X7V4E1_AMPQE
MGTNMSQTSTDSKTPPATYKTSTDSKTPPATNKTSTDSKTLPATNKTSTDSKTPAMSKELNIQHDSKIILHSAPAFNSQFSLSLSVKTKEIARLCRDVKRKNDAVQKLKRKYDNRERYCIHLEEEKAELKRKMSDLETIESKQIKKDKIKRQEEEELIKRRVRIEEVERIRTRAMYSTDIQGNAGVNN